MSFIHGSDVAEALIETTKRVFGGEEMIPPRVLRTREGFTGRCTRLIQLTRNCPGIKFVAVIEKDGRLVVATNRISRDSLQLVKAVEFAASGAIAPVPHDDIAYRENVAAIWSLLRQRDETRKDAFCFPESNVPFIVLGLSTLLMAA